MPQIEIDSDQRLLAQVLPWASNQRWFPSTWPVADVSGSHWPDSFVYRLPRSQILLARPYRDGPWLQIPLLGCEDGTGSPTFWEDWFEQAQTHVDVVSALPLGKEQSNTSVNLHVSSGGRERHWIGKIFRTVYPGNNPDVSVPLQLLHNGFSGLAPIRAFCVLPLPSGAESFTSGVVTDFIDNDGTAYDYFVRAAASARNVDREAFAIGRLLGQMHAALPKFDGTAEPGVFRQRLRDAYAEARLVTDGLPDLHDLVKSADEVSAVTPLSVVHGDLHLGQILHNPRPASPTGEWTFVDFEGEPLRPLTERNEPDYALKDLAGLLRSIHYAGVDHPEWVKQTQAACIEGFRSAGIDLLDPVANASLLRLLEIEKALYEVKYEALYRPDMLHVPLSALQG